MQSEDVVVVDEEKEEEFGWIYCLSNPSYKKDLFKIGITLRTPPERAKDLSRTSGVPQPFVVEFAKWVKNPKKKEKDVHTYMSRAYDRPEPNREFFIAPKQNIKLLFEIFEGQSWKEDETGSVGNGDEEEEQEGEEHSEEERKIGCRDARKCFIDGTRIRHNKAKERIGIYDKKNNEIKYNNKIYKALRGWPRKAPLNQFGMAILKEMTGKNTQINAWVWCECEINGKWISCDEHSKTIKI